MTVEEAKRKPGKDQRLAAQRCTVGNGRATGDTLGPLRNTIRCLVNSKKRVYPEWEQSRLTHSCNATAIDSRNALLLHFLGLVQEPPHQSGSTFEAKKKRKMFFNSNRAKKDGRHSWKAFSFNPLLDFFFCVVFFRCETFSNSRLDNSSQLLSFQIRLFFFFHCGKHTVCVYLFTYSKALCCQ